MTDNLLEVRNLRKTYQKASRTIDVLCGACLSIKQGDMVSVVGVSGSGKSTLLHLLGSLDKPDSGAVIYKQVDLNQLSTAQLADFRNKEIGFVFQFHHLLNEFSALENVMMPALIRRLSLLEAQALAKEALDAVGLSHRLSHKPGELSGGEQQRVALARAVVLRPGLILADEVTGNLDEQTGEEIHQLLFDINQQYNVTFVVVTHNQSLASRMPRRLLLEDGLIKERL